MIYVCITVHFMLGWYYYNYNSYCHYWGGLGHWLGLIVELAFLQKTCAVKQLKKAHGFVGPQIMDFSYSSTETCSGRMAQSMY